MGRTWTFACLTGVLLGTPAPDAAAEADAVAVHGAVRLAYSLRDWDAADRDRRGRFDAELLSLEYDGEASGFLVSAGYRFYLSQGFDTLHHAWIGYDFDRWRAQLGVVKVPFGLLPFASHNWWFGLGYYLGLEDDYDAGIVFESRSAAPWTVHLGFFKQQELAATELDRYSFDLVRDAADGGAAEQQNEEVDQLNLRLARTRAHAAGASTEWGVSAQYGRLYNAATRTAGHRWAAALHLAGDYGPWNLQLQVARYAHRPENPPGVDRDTVQGGFFGAANLIPARGTVYTLNLARTFTVRHAAVQRIQVYNDFSLLEKANDAWRDSWLNTIGARIDAGPVVAYVDLIHGRGAAFLGPYQPGLDDSLRMVQGAGAVERRFNLNIGYYF